MIQSEQRREQKRLKKVKRALEACGKIIKKSSTYVIGVSEGEEKKLNAEKHLKKWSLKTSQIWQKS